MTDTATPDLLRVQGSLDGVNWFDLIRIVDASPSHRAFHAIRDAVGIGVGSNPESEESK